MQVITHTTNASSRHSVEPATVVARIQQLINEADGNVIITFDPLRLHVMNEKTGEELVIGNTDSAGFRRTWLALTATIRHRNGRCIDPRGHAPRNFLVKGDGMVDITASACPEPELTSESVDEGWTLMHTDEQWDDNEPTSSPTPNRASGTNEVTIDDGWDEIPSRAA